MKINRRITDAKESIIIEEETLDLSESSHVVQLLKDHNNRAIIIVRPKV